MVQNTGSAQASYTMISVVIPTLNACRYIPGLIAALRAQSVPCEVLIIDSSSGDDTAALAESAGARVVVIRREAFDHGGTRNLGFRSVSGDPVVFMTQDALPLDDRVIENLAAPFADPAVAYCYGRQVARPDATPLERFARSFNYPEEPLIKGRDEIARLGIKTFFASNVCSAVRRSAFDDAGGFPEKVILNEDMSLAWRLIQRGYRVAYEPRAQVYHSHAYSLGQQFSRYFDIGVFLNRNKEIAGAGGADREGIRFLRDEVALLARTGSWVWIPYAFAEALMKYTGLRLGLKEDLIPDRLRAVFSMHKHFWVKYNTALGSKEVP